MSRLSRNSMPVLVAMVVGVSSCNCSDKKKAICEIGTFEAFYDDFEYSSTELGGVGSIFGTNEWLRCNGDEQLTRAWYKFNYLDGNNAPWTPDASLELANGRVVFLVAVDGLT